MSSLMTLASLVPSPLSRGLGTGLDSGQAKVGHFAYVALTDQDVPGSEVTVDVGVLLQV